MGLPERNLVLVESHESESPPIDSDKAVRKLTPISPSEPANDPEATTQSVWRAALLIGSLLLAIAASVFGGLFATGTATAGDHVQPAVTQCPGMKASF
jgi:hypothetical protein